MDRNIQSVPVGQRELAKARSMVENKNLPLMKPINTPLSPASSSNPGLPQRQQISSNGIQSQVPHPPLSNRPQLHQIPQPGNPSGRKTWDAKSMTQVGASVVGASAITGMAVHTGHVQKDAENTRLDYERYNNFNMRGQDTGDVKPTPNPAIEMSW